MSLTLKRSPCPHLYSSLDKPVLLFGSGDPTEPALFCDPTERTLFSNSSSPTASSSSSAAGVFGWGVITPYDSGILACFASRASRRRL